MIKLKDLMNEGIDKQKKKQIISVVNEYIGTDWVTPARIG